MQTHTVMMPRELTAENGAKAALSGEFFISVTKDCECDCPLDDDECTVCGGSGVHEQSFMIPWDTIKEIYKAAVKRFGD